MQFADAVNDSFDSLSWLEWVILRAKDRELAIIDLEREVPLAIERIRTVLRVNSETQEMMAQLTKPDAKA